MLIQENQTKDVRGGTKDEPKSVQQKAQQREAAKNTGSASKQIHAATLRAGIPGAVDPQDQMADVKRLVPTDEASPLPLNSDLKVVGKRITRLDGAQKTTGRARYTADVYLPGMLYGKMVSSSVPHARIRSIDTSKAQKYPGVKAVYILEHLSGSAEVKDKSKEMPSKFPIVRFAGQPIAGVAATSPPAADEEAKLGGNGSALHPLVTNVVEARKPNAPAGYPAPAE